MGLFLFFFKHKKHNERYISEILTMKKRQNLHKTKEKNLTGYLEENNN